MCATAREINRTDWTATANALADGSMHWSEAFGAGFEGTQEDAIGTALQNAADATVEGLPLLYCFPARP